MRKNKIRIEEQLIVPAKLEANFDILLSIKNDISYICVARTKILDAVSEKVLPELEKIIKAQVKANGQCIIRHEQHIGDHWIVLENKEDAKTQNLFDWIIE
ncbi:hypothetical protein KAW18_02510 [candidate division WOR-3 bacterium]|nr:hypothetical protein [candidate division WOR-3 bacterium]